MFKKKKNWIHLLLIPSRVRIDDRSNFEIVWKDEFPDAHSQLKLEQVEVEISNERSFENYR